MRSLKSLDWATVEPVAPFYLFTRQDAALRDEYQKGKSLPEIFPANVLGFQTHRDAFAVSFTEAETQAKLRELADPTLSDDEMARRYGLKSNRDWSLSDTRSAARNGAATPPAARGLSPIRRTVE